MFINLLNQRQLNKEQDQGGFVSLESIEAEEEVVDASKKSDLDEAAKKQEQEDAAAKAKEEDDARKAEEEETARKVAESQSSSDTKDITSEGGNQDDNGDFWDDVDRLRGEALEVDFGDVDPMTPEGALLIEQAARIDELNKFEENLKETHPRAHAYLTHILGGGSEEEFFKRAGEPDRIPTEAELENDVELQKREIIQANAAKGVSQKAIDAIIKAAIADDELEEMAKEARKERVTQQEKAVKDALEASNQAAAERTQSLANINKYVGDVAATGKIGNITIPEKDRKEFAKSVGSNIQYSNGKFLLVKELNDDNITKILQEQFFSYKNGNLEGLIEKAARTENTKRLLRTVPENKKPLSKQGSPNNEGIVTLGNIDD